MNCKISILIRWLICMPLVLASLVPPAPPAHADEFGPTLRTLKFDGDGDFVEVENGPHPRTAITIEAWVYRFRDDRCETVVGKDWRTGYWLGFCTGRIRFYPRGIGSAVDGNRQIPANVWTHIAVTYDGTRRRYYVNGELDLDSTAGSGPLTSNDAPLGIGADPRSGYQTGFFYYFYGMLDEVRIWDVVRTQEEIRADMYREVWSRGGLRGVWRLNGHHREAEGRYSSLLRGNPRFDTNGVLPQDLTVPRTTSSVTVDGRCQAAEYGAAERVGLRERSYTTVYIQHTATDLYVCFAGLERAAGRSAAVAIDRDGSRHERAQPGDYRFVITVDGAIRAEEGDGAGGFRPLSPPAGSWSVAASYDEFFWHAEFRLSRTLLGLPEDWSATVGMEAVELGGGLVANNPWPVGAVENRPASWAAVRFSNLVGPVPSFSFSGRVTDTRGNGIANVTVHLIGSGSLLDTARTGGSGDYTLLYRGYSPSLFYVQEIDPRGVTSVSADAGPDGTALSANLLVYPGAASGRSYLGGRFVDALDPGMVPAFNRHYLIVYSPPVRDMDLWPLVDMKQLQGYQVETISTETINLTVSGRDLAEKVRNWLRSRWQAYRPNPVYALLVGRGDKIPVREVGWEGPRAYRTPGPNYVPALVTDWYYADLDSNWDTNNNGFYGEYLFCAPGEREVPPERPGGPLLECPPPGSPLREGPFGSSAGPEDDWKAEIALGRLPLNTPAEVRRALRAMAATEASGSPDKRNALLAAAFWGFDGRSWSQGANRYIDGGRSVTVDGTMYGADGALYFPWDGVKPFGLDSAEHLNVTLRPILQPEMNITALYQTTAPGGDPALSPSRQPADAALSGANMDQQWRDRPFGLVNVEGHGDGDGVYAQHWTEDWNDNRQIENPVRPREGRCGDEPCYELTPPRSFIHAFMPERLGIVPVVFANACSTGDVWIIPPGGRGDWRQGRETVASRLLANGRVAAWVGGLNIVPVSALDPLQDWFNRDIVEAPLRLGDALWKGMEAIIRVNPGDWRLATMQLFGDPAFSYWGNPADMRAFWPQAGRDWFASSATTANGPSAGLRLWTTTTGTPRTAPVVNRYGLIVVAGSSQILRFRPDGTLLDSRPLAVAPDHQPALATEGVYVVAGNTLRVFDRDLNPRDTRTLTLGNEFTGAPRIGPDGVVWLPTRFGIMRYTPGSLTLINSFGSPRGPVALTRGGGGVWTNDNGAVRLYLVDRYGGVIQRELAPASGPTTAPAVGPDDHVYVGRGNAVVSLSLNGTQRWAYDTGAEVTATPAIGLNGTIYAVNRNGRVVALAPDGTLRWRQDLGTSILATPAVDHSLLYVAAGTHLYALSVATGEVRWRVDLGAPVDARSAPVIGANRTVYVTTGDGRLVAVGQAGWLSLPSEVVAEAGIGQVIIRWRDNSVGETGFRIERCAGGVCAWIGNAPANATSFTATQLPAGQPFVFRVQALGSEADGLSGAAAMAAEPGEGIIAAELGEGVTTIEADMSIVVTEGEGAMAAEAGASVEAAQTGDAVFSSDYAFSEPVEALPPLPGAPSNLQAAPRSSESVEVRWSYAGDASQLLGFEVLRSDRADGTYAVVGSVGAGATLFTDRDLAPGTTYFYKVRARNATGDSGLAGPVSAATLPATLPAPTQLRVRVQQGSVQLAWQDNATNESAYVVERRAPGVASFEVIAALPANATGYTDAFNLVDGIYQYRVKAVAASAESPYVVASAHYGQKYSLYLPLLSKP
ncbi:MAG: LamG-like jellyroll fold domain-containing protein [Anaerolineae bacterium]|nr:LamG-like jellyroll fold domain-containing protein [Anaerolineae bacterium]